jgi:hypothetical protein
LTAGKLQDEEEKLSGHPFNFNGGGELASMGAAWFVSYSYYNIDETHTNWETVSTYRYRISVFEQTGNFHQFWLTQVLDMNDDNLEKNEIGLTGPQIKQMARELLAIKGTQG